MVLVIAGLALAVALPRFGFIPEGVTLSRTVNTINAAFYSASSLALASGRPVALNFEFEHQRIRLEPQGTAVALASPAENLDEPEVEEQPRGSVFMDLELFLLPPTAAPAPLIGDAPEDEMGHFLFYPNGEAAGAILYLRVGSRALVVDVDRLTGRPLLSEGDF